MKKLKPEELQSLINKLHDAHSKIKKGGWVYVCNALGHCDTWESVYLRQWVSEMIDGKSTLLSWMLDNKKLPEKVSDDSENLALYMKETRLRWIMWMINQLEDERA